MQQEQQGFAYDQKIELVDFNYKPLSIQQQSKRKIFSNGHFNRHTQLHNDKLSLIDDTLRQQCTKSVIMREQKNIVFNNFNHQVGLQENNVTFDADLKSGNLEIAIRRKFLEYQLYMRPDTNTTSHFQWFYFKVKSIKGKKNITFTLKNFIKSAMLYNSGLKPFYKSNKHNSNSFKQLQTEVKYYQSNEQNFYNLRFSYQFDQNGQEVYFASQPPYTFSMLIDYMIQCRGQRQNLCKSLLNKKVPYLIYNDTKNVKAVAVVIARQHPGESVGSWMMEGFLSKIDSLKASESILWVIVPMMNIDGVFLGNNRTGITGNDFNRSWNAQQIQKKQKLFPEHAALINLIKSLRRKHQKKLKLFLDLHGHSSQPNVFTYGPPHEQNSQFYYMSRIFPELLSKKNQNFSLQQCSYIIKPDKKNSFRNFIYNYFNIPFIYTIEASFGIMRDKSVHTEQFLKIGEDIAEISNQFLTNFVVKQKNSEISGMIDYVKEKYKESLNEVQQFDSSSETSNNDNQNNLRDMEEKINKLVYDSPCKPIKFQRERVVTEIVISSGKSRENSLDQNAHLFKIQHSINHRYSKISDKKRNQTQTSLYRANKMSFLPKIKENLSSRYKLKTPIKETQTPLGTQGPSMMNIKQIQKRLFKLRNSRIGKKILIINAYGV